MNIPEIGLAFLEGVALIVSPCILPVLPLVLSASIEGGRKRPYGIIVGFVGAFSIFVLGSRALITALHIDLDIIKYGSLALLLAFGLVLLSDKLSARFSQWTQGAAELGNRLGAQGHGGFLSGVSIGALIGLVWTPCAGPILAAVLVQVIRQQTDIQGILVTIAFAIGAGVPMLIMTLAGRKIMGRLRFFTTHAETVRKSFGVIIILSVLLLAFDSSAQSLFTSDSPSSTLEATRLEDGLATPYAAPEFTGIESWLNSPPLTLQSLRGKAVLIDFWTYSCINCVRTLPYLTAWDKKYRDKGLVIIGVHAPEFEFEKKIDNIKTAIAKYGIAYPVAVDNNLSTWVAFKNRYWPAHYLIDKEGRVVYTHFGEGKYSITENNIRYVLGLKDKAEAMPEISTISLGQTPETYLGYARAEHFAGKPDLQEDVVTAYKVPLFLPLNEWALAGKWKVEAQKSTAQEKGAALQLNFRSKKVFLVMGTQSGKPAKATLKLNGETPGASSGKDAPNGNIAISGHALYELIHQSETQNSLLEITAQDPGVEIYAFTFGK
ncbi:MAG: cytochrome c biogenesis protein DipZ [Alphaproteobacteria bacterium]|nr:cytochrome c biogenesis protein DipZ [Alphaproteobacteria bacterium]